MDENALSILISQKVVESFLFCGTACSTCKVKLSFGYQQSFGLFDL